MNLMHEFFKIFSLGDSMKTLTIYLIGLFGFFMILLGIIGRKLILVVMVLFFTVILLLGMLFLTHF